MSKDVILSIFRSLLTAAGSYLAGKFLLGTELDDNLIAGWISALAALGSAIWGWVDKSATVEAIQSAFRSVIVAIGTLLVGAGIFNEQVLETVLLIASSVIAASYGVASRFKSKQIATGEVRVADLAGVDPGKTPIAPDTTPVKTKK